MSTIQLIPPYPEFLETKLEVKIFPIYGTFKLHNARICVNLAYCEFLELSKFFSFSKFFNN